MLRRASDGYAQFLDRIGPYEDVCVAIPYCQLTAGYHRYREG